MLFLTGFMGAGKSTVGPLLAAKLGVPFVDLDVLVEADAGATIAEQFARDGEAAFRDREAAVLARVVASGADAVVALGGGVLLREDNRFTVRGAGRSVALTATPAELGRRVDGAGTRPLLSGAGDVAARIAALLVERGPIYQGADLVVDTTGRAPDAVAGEIASWLRST